MRTGAQAAAAAYPVRPWISSINFFFFFFFFAVILILSSSSSICCSAEELGVDQVEVLRRFKAALNGAGEPALADWNANPAPPCEGNVGRWRGVLCFGGHVFGLQLENMALSGRIDVDALAPLRSLRTLSFMSNKFEGAMPDWKKLGALKSLFLSNNGFSGEIADDAFRGMTSLKKVHLANNKFSGPVPTSLESPKLIELRLENNQFIGKIPEISSDHLKVLNVSNNQLEGPIPLDLQKLNPKSFAGNKALCGPPLDTQCPGGMEAAFAGNKGSSVKIALIAAACLLGLILLIILLVLLRRSKKQEPNLGQPEATPVGGVDRNAAAARAVVAEAAAITAAKKSEQSAAAAHQQTAGGGAGRLTFVNEERRKFDLQDLMRASAEVLGSGNFGASYKAVLVDGEALVVKRFKQMNNIAKEDFHEHMRRLGRLKHQNLLPLVAYLYRKEEKLLVFDYVSNASLAKHLHGKHSEDHPGLPWPARLKIIKGVAKALIYLHNELPSLTVPHAHLKSSNVLLDEEFNPLLMDYTLAPVVNPSQVQQVLVAYKSPEYTTQYRVCKKTDVWCLGILILEVVTGKFVIAQGCGHHSADLAGWIHAIVQEVSKDGRQAFDKEMAVASEKGRAAVEELLQIGIACCEEDLEKRLELEEAVKKIENLREEEE
ncbi:pollen receptor-like kinase 2 [Andrographis paniculata]|uniref:pollen receptor-like kinase 2 n=1 Tax=Andrographis paniculata TaxID=175694 RepID=UPI0021E74866|nr:pollen receptor-like kinase 2 [Andrographis paniculata]